jgi:hypothetical protein
VSLLSLRPTLRVRVDISHPSLLENKHPECPHRWFVVQVCNHEDTYTFRRLRENCNIEGIAVRIPPGRSLG